MRCSLGLCKAPTSFLESVPHSGFSSFVVLVVVFYKITLNTELENAKSLLLVRYRIKFL